MFLISACCARMPADDLGLQRAISQLPGAAGQARTMHRVAAE
jgi:hypothetical protein